MTETDMSVRRLPDNVYIARGAHSPGDPAAGDPACTMEWASWAAGEAWSDHPECTHPVLAAAARAVNDGLDEEPRQRLAELIPSLIGTADHHDDPLARHQLSVRLAAWAAERVLHLIPPSNRTVCMRAIAAARAWADAPTGEARAVAQAAAAAVYDVGDAAADVAGFYAAVAAAHAAQAAAAPTYDYAAPAFTYAVGAAAQAAAATDDPVGLLRGLIAEHTRLTKQEG